MGVTLVRGRRWPVLLDELAQQVKATHTDPFVHARVVVSSPATGRIVSQQVAARLGISSGISYLTPARLLAGLAESAGLARDRARWLGTPLDMAVRDAVTELSDTHPVLARAADPERVGGLRATASRVARLWRWYLDVAPSLLASWLDGEDTDPAGEPLAPRWAWQPELFRATLEALEVDPLDTLAAITATARAQRTPTVLFAVDELTAPQRQVLEAFTDLTVLAVADSPGAAWAEPLATRCLDLADQRAPSPTVSLHDSHGPSRQVEVLRDELTRAFADDPTLEPRDVLIVCPQPQRFATLLDGAFRQSVDGGHPGRGLRVQTVADAQGNPVVPLLSTLLRLGDLRASASQLVDLLLDPAIAHRWRLGERQAVIELVGGAGVRWGMDAQHRATFSLEGLAQNTWMRGLDRLLVGLAVSPGHDGGLRLAGSESVTASDLDTVGALCEIVSRLRRLISESTTPATIVDWVGRTRAVIADLIGPPHEEQWQVLHAHRVLATLESDHLDSTTLLTRAEFAHLLTDAEVVPRARAAAGNGALQVVGLGELRHVEFRLVALLGVTDDAVPGHRGTAPDAIDLGGLAPDLRQRRLTHLLGHARCAERLLVVRQGFSQHTNNRVPAPSALTWLFEELGVSPEPVRHPATATAEGNYIGEASFDMAAHAGALAHRGPTVPGSLRARRRREALVRAPGPLPQQVTLGQLAGFLADPAKAFLRSAANLPLYRELTLSDEMALGLAGLDQWRVSSTLLDALKNATPLETVIRMLRNNEELPPDEIGRAEFTRAKATAEMVWREAAGLYRREVSDVEVDLSFDLAGLGRVRLIDSVRLRGGEAVSLTISKGTDKLLSPWLESLALTACGTPTRAHSFRPIQDPGNWKETIVAHAELGESEQAEAHARLTMVLRAYCLGQHRLIPLPPAAAIRYAAEVARMRFDPQQWRGAPGWRHRKWDAFGEAWALFYDEEVAELFADPPTPEDPVNGQPSAFGAWATALYTGLEGVG